MTLGVDKLTDEELLKVVIAIAEMLETSISKVAEKLEEKDMHRLVRALIKNRKLWDK